MHNCSENTVGKGQMIISGFCGSSMLMLICYFGDETM
jgi:hypothetical protein